MRAKIIATTLLALASIANADNAATQGGPSQSSSADPQAVNLRELLLDLGPRLHKIFILSPLAAERVDLGGLHQKDMTYPQLLSLLWLHGLVAVADGGTVQVISNIDVRATPLPIVAPENLKALDDEVVTCLLLVKNLNAVQLVPLLRPMVPQWGHLQALPDRNALLMVDRAGNIRRLIELIKALESMPKAPGDSKSPADPAKP